VTDQTISIVHVSDLHLGEDLVEEATKRPRFMHRYGHDVSAFFALDRKLKELDWDALVVSGDISRAGGRNSFVWAKNWLEGKLVIGDSEIGLNLASRGNPYFIVPGNHDRFNDRFRQDELSNYLREFPVIAAGTKSSLSVAGKTLNFHLYDSSCRDGGFAYGTVADETLMQKQLKDDEIDIAVIHHHILQPLTQPREKATELLNSREVLSHFLGCDFDLIMFGHTHNYWFDVIPPRLLGEVVGSKRVFRSYFRRFLPRWVLRSLAPECGVAYHRVATRNGKYPTVSRYFEYLYLKFVLKREVKGPEQFATPKAFSEYIAAFAPDLSAQLRDMKRRRIAISMAPSACQAEASAHGFHRVTMRLKDDKVTQYRWELYSYKGGEFERVKVKDFPAST
jgi:predicted phosphodiesterase